MKVDSRFLSRPDTSATVRLTVDGEPLLARTGDTVAAAILAHSGNASRETGKGSPRTAFCMMGVCFDCLIEVDGSPNVQACMVQVRDGMVLRRPRGFRAFEGVVNDKSEPPVLPFDSAQGTAPCSTRGLSGAEARNRDTDDV